MFFERMQLDKKKMLFHGLEGSKGLMDFDIYLEVPLGSS
jgi:hypothetical protein